MVAGAAKRAAASVPERSSAPRSSQRDVSAMRGNPSASSHRQQAVRARDVADLAADLELVERPGGEQPEPRRRGQVPRRRPGARADQLAARADPQVEVAAQERAAPLELGEEAPFGIGRLSHVRDAARQRVTAQLGAQPVHGAHAAFAVRAAKRRRVGVDQVLERGRAVDPQRLARHVESRRAAPGVQRRAHAPLALRPRAAHGAAVLLARAAALDARGRPATSRCAAAAGRPRSDGRAHRPRADRAARRVRAPRPATARVPGATPCARAAPRAPRPCPRRRRHRAPSARSSRVLGSSSRAHPAGAPQEGRVAPRERDRPLRLERLLALGERQPAVAARRGGAPPRHGRAPTSRSARGRPPARQVPADQPLVGALERERRTSSPPAVSARAQATGLAAARLGSRREVLRRLARRAVRAVDDETVPVRGGAGTRSSGHPRDRAARACRGPSASTAIAPAVPPRRGGGEETAARVLGRRRTRPTR